MHGISDEYETVWMCIKRDLDGGWVEVLAICDDAEPRTWLTFGNAQHAENTWVAVVEWAHCIEQMRDHSGAGTNRC